jgi:hypothetical protein
MTRIWRSDVSSERTYTRATLLNVGAFAGVGILTEESLIDRFPGARIRIDSDGPPVDFFSCGPLFIVSNRIVAVIEKFPARYELFPVNVEYRGHPYSEENYFFLHIRDEVDCLDKSASIYIEKAGYLGDFRKLAIDESKIRGNNLFRLARAYQTIVLTSDGLAESAEAAGIVGASFIAPSAFRRIDRSSEQVYLF